MGEARLRTCGYKKGRGILFCATLSTASAQSSGGRLLYMRLRIRKLTHFGVSFSATSYAVLIIHRQCAIVIFLRMNKLRCQYTFCQSFEFGYAVFCLVVFLLIGDVSRNLVNMRD